MNKLTRINDVERAARAIFLQCRYLKEKREALDDLGAWIARLASGLKLADDASAQHKHSRS